VQSFAWLGETLHAIVIDQFRRLCDGDRFWFENDLYFFANPALLGRIRSVTLADVIRRNTSLDNQLPDNLSTFTALHDRWYSGAWFSFC